MIEAVVPGVIAVVGGLAGTGLTLAFGRRQSQANVDLSRANAEQIRVATATTAADTIRRLSEDNAELIGRMTEQMQAVMTANAEHEDWDRLMVESLRRMRDAMTSAGINLDVGALPDPPPLARWVREDDAA